MVKITKVVDPKPKNEAVIDYKPKNELILDVKPNNQIIRAFENQTYEVTVGAGMLVGFGPHITYPTGFTVISAKSP